MARGLQRWAALGCCLLALVACTREIKERCRFVTEHVQAPALPAGFAEVDRLFIRRVTAMTQTSRELQMSAEPSAAQGHQGQRLEPTSIKPGMELDPTRVQILRGGTDFTLKPGETKLDPVTGFVKPSHGLSLDANPASVERFGGAHQIKSIPPQLKIIQRGARLEHFEIVPREPMTHARLQELLNQIEVY